jgi:hypothetical protein
MKDFVDHLKQTLQDFSVFANIFATEFVHQFSQVTNCFPNYVGGAMQG